MIASTIYTTELGRTFLFENSLIGAYCNRLYDFGERHGSFLRYDGSKANSAAKELDVTNVNTKESPPNRQISLSLIVKTSTIWALPSIFDYILLTSSPLPILEVRMISL